MSLSPEQLERRSKELDAQEEYVASQLKLLENAPITLKVYEARFTAKNEQLDGLQAEIVVAQRRLNEILEATNSETSRLDSLNLEYKTASGELLAQQRELTDSVKKLKAESKATQVEIDRRNSYLLSLEEQIDKANNDGNESILDLQSQAAKLTYEIGGLKTDKLDLQRLVDDLTLASGDLQDAYEESEHHAEARKAELKLSLDKAQKEYIEATVKYEKVNTEIADKMAILKQKEESLIAKTDALALERQQLAQDKRRWENKKSNLYADEV